MWLAVAVIIGLGLFLSKDRDATQYEMKQVYSQPNLEGLKFIDAGDPYIRVCIPCHLRHCQD
jgi:hypothetical protein